MRRGPTLWLTAGVALLATGAGAAFAYANWSTPVHAATTARVQRGAVELTSSAAGTVQAAGPRGLSFSTSGTVTEIDVKAGDSVSAGQVLAKIDASSVQDEVDSAQGSVDSATDTLTKAQQSASPSPSPSRSSAGCQNTGQVAPVALAWDTPSPSPASPEPSRSSSPTPSPTPSPTRPTPTNPGGGQHGGSCASASSTRGAGGRSGTNDSLMSAEQQLTNAKLALRLAEEKLAGTTITAPVAGKVLSVAGSVGVPQTPGGTGFIVLGDVVDTAVRAQFSEADVARLAVGQTATITLPDKGGQQVKGKVSQIDPAGTMSGRLVRYGVLVAFDQVPDDLLLGQSANVAVTTASATNVLYVPSTAVTGVNNGAATVTVRSGRHDEQRTVQVGLRGDQYTEIRSGLGQGDELVISAAR